MTDNRPPKRLLEMVFPDHTNHLGTVVTARSEQVDFKLPIRQGQLVETVARVVAIGRSSMQVEVELVAEDLLSGERELCTRGRFTMIALDARGRPAPVPAFAT